MKDKLTALYNTLCLVETKGAATVTMAGCLNFLHQMLDEIQKEESVASADDKQEA